MLVYSDEYKRSEPENYYDSSVVSWNISQMSCGVRDNNRVVVGVDNQLGDDGGEMVMDIDEAYKLIAMIEFALRDHHETKVKPRMTEREALGELGW